MPLVTSRPCTGRSPGPATYAKPRDVLNLVDKLRLRRQLERLASVRFQAERRPGPAHRLVRNARLPGHALDRPVHRVDRHLVQRPINHFRDLVIHHGAESTAAILVRETLLGALIGERNAVAMTSNWRKPRLPALNRNPHLEQ